MLAPEAVVAAVVMVVVVVVVVVAVVVVLEASVVLLLGATVAVTALVLVTSERSSCGVTVRTVGLESVPSAETVPLASTIEKVVAALARAVAFRPLTSNAHWMVV